MELQITSSERTERKKIALVALGCKYIRTNLLVKLFQFQFLVVNIGGTVITWLSEICPSSQHNNTKPRPRPGQSNILVWDARPSLVIGSLSLAESLLSCSLIGSLLHHSKAETQQGPFLLRWGDPLKKNAFQDELEHFTKDLDFFSFFVLFNYLS